MIATNNYIIYYMIYYMINSFLIGSFFAIMITRKFPREAAEIGTNITFNAIYLYSKLQIFFYKNKKNVNNFIKASPLLLFLKDKLFSIIPTNNVVERQFIINGEIVCSDQASTYDFALISRLCEKNHCVNKKIVYDLDKYDNIFECSDIKFMLVEINIGSNVYKVDLKTNHYNFYLLDNKLTKHFFIYYLKQHLHVKEPINYNEKFCVKIIDHEANLINIDFLCKITKTRGIVLKKTSYVIITDND